jgi:carbon storage regulator
MLILARKAGQSVVINGNIRVTVERIRRQVVRLKVEAPREIRVDREEVWIRRVCEKPVRSGKQNTVVQAIGQEANGYE